MPCFSIDTIMTYKIMIRLIGRDQIAKFLRGVSSGFLFGLRSIFQSGDPGQDLLRQPENARTPGYRSRSSCGPNFSTSKVLPR